MSVSHKLTYTVPEASLFQGSDLGLGKSLALYEER